MSEEKKSHPIIPDDAKAVCMACGKKFLVGDGPHICPDTIRAAAEEATAEAENCIIPRNIGVSFERDRFFRYIEQAIRAQVERERERIKDILSRSLTDGEKYKLIDEGG